jgi:hypothetical protein
VLGYPSPDRLFIYGTARSSDHQHHAEGGGADVPQRHGRVEAADDAVAFRI